jgi:hypothetical protein
MPELTRFGLTVDTHATLFTLVGPNPYTVGGITLDVAGTKIFVSADNDAGYVTQYNYTTQKLLVMQNGAINTVHTEIGAISLAAVNFRIFAVIKP